MITQVKSGASTLEAVRNKHFVTVRLNGEQIHLTPNELTEFVKGLQALIEDKK